MDYALNFPQHLGLYLKSLRKAKGMSQAALASLLKVTQSRVAAIEKDPSTVSMGQVMSILGLLDAQLVVRANTAHASIPASARTPQDLALDTTPSPTQAIVAKPEASKAAPMRPLSLPADWQSHTPKGQW